MSYTSFIYLLLVGGTVLGYYLFPRKIRWIVLLAANMIFYYQAGWQELLILVLTALVTWRIGLRIGALSARVKAGRKEGLSREERDALKKRKGHWVLAGMLVTLGILGICKYTNFVISIVSRIGHLGDPKVISLVVPLGLSFYTFMMVAYLLDVSNGKIAPQKNFLKYLLFVSFFPSVVQGPINRYGQLSDQLTEGHRLEFENLRDGAILIAWGFAKKLIVSERLATFVSAIFDQYRDYHGLIILIAAAIYSIQTYADFSGCMDIGRGTARMLGIRLPDNFLRPYFARTLPEFWRRWHITMSSFFRDYVFFPFSVSRASRKISKWARSHFSDRAARIIAACMPIMVVWVLTGLWHGAETKYICWGLYHGVLIMLSTIFTDGLHRLGTKIHLPMESFGFRIFQSLRTYLLCSIGRFFFRAPSVMAALTLFGNMFRGVHMENIADGAFFNYGVNMANMIVVLVFTVAWFIVSVLQETGHDVLAGLSHLNIVLRWALLYALIIGVFVFGKYGPGYDVSAFIYEQF